MIPDLLLQPAQPASIINDASKCLALPIDIWNEISYLDIHIYHTLALAIRELERDLSRRKHHFAVLKNLATY